MAGIPAIGGRAKKRGPQSSSLGVRAAGCLVLPVAALLLLFLVVGPLFLNRTRTHPPWSGDVANLKMLGLALRMYADDHSGLLPPNLADVWALAGSPDTFVSDVSGTEAPASAEQVLAGQTDYLYFPDRPYAGAELSPAEPVILATRPGLYTGGGVCIGSAGGGAVYVGEPSRELIRHLYAAARRDRQSNRPVIAGEGSAEP